MMTADALVGEKVHALMWRAQMPQRELAAALELDQSAVSKKLRGRRAWTLDELLAAAQVLHVDVAAIMPDADYQPAPSGRGRVNTGPIPLPIAV